MSRGSGIWIAVNKETTRNVDKENENKKNGGKNQVLQRKHWNHLKDS